MIENIIPKVCSHPNTAEGVMFGISGFTNWMVRKVPSNVANQDPCTGLTPQNRAANVSSKEKIRGVWSVNSVWRNDEVKVALKGPTDPPRDQFLTCLVRYELGKPPRSEKPHT